LLTNGTISCSISMISPRLIGEQALGSQVRSGPMKELRRGFCLCRFPVLTQGFVLCADAIYPPKLQLRQLALRSYHAGPFIFMRNDSSSLPLLSYS